MSVAFNTANYEKQPINQEEGVNTKETEELEKTNNTKGSQNIDEGGIPEARKGNPNEKPGIPDIPPAPVDFSMTRACASFSDMAEALKEVMKLMNKMRLDNSTVMYDANMAKAESFKKDANKILENAKKSYGYEIASAVCKGVFTAASGVSDGIAGYKGVKSAQATRNAGVAKNNNNVEQARLFKADAAEAEAKGKTWSGVGTVAKGAGDLVSGILDAQAEWYKQETQSVLKESEADRSVMDAQLQALKDSSDNCVNTIRNIVDLLSQTVKTEESTRRSVLG